eukprot:g24793.t1
MWFSMCKVNEQGDFMPLRQEVETKSVNVHFSLITPDGEPAPHCDFELKPRFAPDGTAAEALSLPMITRAPDGAIVWAGSPQAGMRVTAQPVHTRGISLVYARSVSPPANGRSGSPVQWVPGWSPHEGPPGAPAVGAPLPGGELFVERTTLAA